MDWIDISVPLRDDMIVFTGEPPFRSRAHLGHRRWRHLQRQPDGARCPYRNARRRAHPLRRGRCDRGGHRARRIDRAGLGGRRDRGNGVDHRRRPRPLRHPGGRGPAAVPDADGAPVGRTGLRAGLRRARLRRPLPRSSAAACGRSGSTTCRSRRSATRSRRTGSCSRRASWCSRGWTCGTWLPGRTTCCACHSGSSAATARRPARSSGRGAERVEPRGPTRQDPAISERPAAPPSR